MRRLSRTGMAGLFSKLHPRLVPAPSPFASPILVTPPHHNTKFEDFSCINTQEEEEEDEKTRKFTMCVVYDTTKSINRRISIIYADPRASAAAKEQLPYMLQALSGIEEALSDIHRTSIAIRACKPPAAPVTSPSTAKGRKGSTPAKAGRCWRPSSRRIRRDCANPRRFVADRRAQSFAVSRPPAGRSSSHRCQGTSRYSPQRRSHRTPAEW